MPFPASAGKIQHSIKLHDNDELAPESSAGAKA